MRRAGGGGVASQTASVSALALTPAPAAPAGRCAQGLLYPVVQGVMGLGQYHSPRPEALVKGRSTQGAISVTAMGGLA